MILPAALSGRFLFSFVKALVSLRVANAACVALSHVYRGWSASFSAQPVDGRRFQPFLDIWNVFLCLLCWYSNNRNQWSRSGIC